MMNHIPTPVLTCSLCGGRREVRFSLPLARSAGGNWEARPICVVCRGGLVREATSRNQSIRLFSLIGSEKEAERRNALAGKFRIVLDAFASAPKVGTKRA